jgi:integrase
MAWIEQTGQHTWRVRYPHDDRHSHYGSVSGFTTAKAARDYANGLESDRRRGQWIDPASSKITASAWSSMWVETLDVETRTEENYRSYLRNHILPRWGYLTLGDITALDVTTWRKDLRKRYAASTVDGIVTVFSMMLDDAVDQRLIPVNPVHRRRRRGRRRDHSPTRAEKVFAMPEHVLRIADQATMLGGPSGGLLVITAAWTGCRWGELAGLQRDHVHLDRGVIVIDPEYGALHESTHGLWLGPPKTPASARTITLPPFLIDLLREHLSTTPGTFVFTSPLGCRLRRSTFDRRVFRPAVDGNLRKGTHPIRPGLTFHGLRHSHKTWLIADKIPEIAQARRLGHHLSNRLAEVYSHVAPEIETELITNLERRWHYAHQTRRPTDNRPRHTPPTPRSTQRAPHSAAALRTTRERRHRRFQPQLTMPHRTGMITKQEAKILPNSSTLVHNRGQHPHRTALTKLMRKALRPGKTTRSKGFDQLWS